MTYTEEFKYKCPVDWTPVTHTITFEKADQVRFCSEKNRMFQRGIKMGNTEFADRDLRRL